jgi:glycosyltransferase involved in cell wall biosynthesis
MRLVWAGPWNERSAIATFGSKIVQELTRRGHEVEVLRTEAAQELGLPPLHASCPVRAVQDCDLGPLIRDVDGVIVNIGDHYGYHSGGIPLLFHAAPLLVLHDAALSGFTHGWRLALGEDSWRIDQMCGHDGSVAPFCALASGVVVHSSHYRAAAEAACSGPVATIPLAWAAADLPPPRAIGDRLVVTTVGHVNRNKRVDEILRAIGTSARLRDRVLYVAAGPVEEPEQERLLALARHVGARPPHFTGWVPDEVLRMIIAGTDVACCLRDPALEGGSASLVLALLSGRPTLVSNHASYADVPDGLVLKCPPGDEAAAVQHHLETILDDPASARAMGEQARKYAQRQHSPSAYVDSLLPALDAAARAQPAVRTALGIGRHLARLGMAPGDPAIERLDAARAALLGEPPGEVLTDKIKMGNSAYE